jgi:hypothetical protein
VHVYVCVHLSLSLRVFAAVDAKGDHSEKTVQNRVVLRMVNEAVFCLQDGTLQTATDGDIGAVFGYARPPKEASQCSAVCVRVCVCGAR